MEWNRETAGEEKQMERYTAQHSTEGQWYTVIDSHSGDRLQWR
jgi:hypothetical protein